MRRRMRNNSLRVREARFGENMRSHCLSRRLIGSERVQQAAHERNLLEGAGENKRPRRGLAPVPQSVMPAARHVDAARASSAAGPAMTMDKMPQRKRPWKMPIARGYHQHFAGRPSISRALL